MILHLMVINVGGLQVATIYLNKEIIKFTDMEASWYESSYEIFFAFITPAIEIPNKIAKYHFTMCNLPVDCLYKDVNL